MARTYITRAGDMLDLICYRAYGGRQAGAVEAVLDANRGLARASHRAIVLPQGLELTLPDLPEAVTTRPLVKLWD